MTDYKKKKGNRIIKFAYLFSIYDTLKKKGRSELDFDTYENDSQYIHFRHGEFEFRLIGVEAPSPEQFCMGELGMYVLSRTIGVRTSKWEEFYVKANIQDIRIGTMEKIAYEVYDWVKDAEEEDWEIYKEELIANWLDSHM